jgi:DNA-binding PadR family transcriptional regulator
MKNRLREFEELVLLSVLVAGGDAYGVSIQRILESDAGRPVLLGPIYTALDRLSQKGLVESELGAPLPVRGGRRKRLYQLTPAGVLAVNEARRVRDTLWAKIDAESPERAGLK